MYESTVTDYVVDISTGSGLCGPAKSVSLCWGEFKSQGVEPLRELQSLAAGR